MHSSRYGFPSLPSIALHCSQRRCLRHLRPMGECERDKRQVRSCGSRLYLTRRLALKKRHTHLISSMVVPRRRMTHTGDAAAVIIYRSRSQKNCLKLIFSTTVSNSGHIAVGSYKDLRHAVVFMEELSLGKNTISIEFVSWTSLHA